jgi:AcrR family transcriptional regulator
MTNETKMKSRRRRRNSAQLRRDILVAAQHLFSEKGYAATSTREIAEQAQAAERLIYRHFQKKATLFAAAVFEPVERSLAEQLNEAKIAELDHMNPVDGTRFYAEMVIGSVRRDKRLFIAYLNAITFHRNEFSHLEELYPASFHARLMHLEHLTLETPTESRFLISDPYFEVRLTLMFLWSVALFDDVFFEKTSSKDDEREMRSIVKLLTMGIGIKDLVTHTATPRDLPRIVSPDQRTLAQENHELRMLLSDSMLEIRALKKRLEEKA